MRVRVRIEGVENAGDLGSLGLESFELVEQVAQLTLGAGVAERGAERGVEEGLGLASWLLELCHSIQRRTRVPELRFRYGPETRCYVCNHRSD